MTQITQEIYYMTTFSLKKTAHSNKSAYRKKYVFPVLLLLGTLMAVSAKERPNVILINIDNHHKGSLSFYGNTFIETPNIDRLFEEGLRMENYHCAGRCTSSRSALMTGRYHARNASLGTGGAWGQMVEGVKTLGHLFAENGYRTAHFGKWHMGDTYPLRPEDRGFQESLSIHNGSIIGQVVVTPGYNDSPRAAAAYRFRHNGEWKVYEGFRTDTWFVELCRYLEENKDQENPFFVHLATVTAHGPNFGPEDLQKKYKAKYEQPEWAKLRTSFENGLSKRKNKGSGPVSYPYDHAADVACLDRNIGRLLDALDRLNLTDDTLIIFASDGNGGGPTTLKGADLKYGGTGTPLVFRWSGLKNGPAASRPENVANIDLLPTLADLCGIKMPAEQLDDIDGQSFASMLGLSEAKPWKKRAVVLDHQSVNKSKAENYLMLMKPLNSATVVLPSGETVSWKHQEVTTSTGPEVVTLAEQQYEKWLKHVLGDFPMGAFGKVHPDSPVGFLRSYPIVDGPAGEGRLNYFMLDVAEDGMYELDKSTMDRYGDKQTTSAPNPYTLTLSKQISPGHVPAGYDEALGGYRVLPNTLKSDFKTSQQEIKIPGSVSLKQGRYLLHLSRSGKELIQLRIAHQPER